MIVKNKSETGMTWRKEIHCHTAHDEAFRMLRYVQRSSFFASKCRSHMPGEQMPNSSRNLSIRKGNGLAPAVLQCYVELDDLPAALVATTDDLRYPCFHLPSPEQGALYRITWVGKLVVQ